VAEPPPPPEPPPSLALGALGISEEAAAVVRKAIYDQRLLQSVAILRRGFGNKEVDHIYAGILGTGSSFHGSSLANRWAFERLAEQGLIDIPRELVRQYSAELRLAGSVAGYLRERRTSRPPDHVTPTTIEAVCGELKAQVCQGRAPDQSKFMLPIDWDQFLLDIERAKRLAAGGIPIFVDPGFVSSSQPGPCPKGYKEALGAVNALILDNCRAGLGVMVSPSVAQEICPGFHLQNFGWAATQNKVKGRLTSNCTGVAAVNSRAIPLNTPFVKQEAIRRWGEIAHPTIGDIAAMITRAQREFGKGNVVLCKDDIRGYFQLCFFAPWATRLMAFAVHSPDPDVEGSIYFSLAGNFGWSGTPFAYEVFTRLFRAVIGWSIIGYFLMYCDDLMLASSRTSWTSDRSIAVRTLVLMFGAAAHATEKFDSTEGKSQRAIDYIGWQINLTTNSIMPSRKNQERAMFFFFAVDLQKPLSMRQRQRLCSLAERYSLVYRELKVLMIFLYQLLGGRERVNREQPLPLGVIG
jgi:hypothetical protein